MMLPKNKKLIVVLLLFSTFFISGCTSETNTSQQNETSTKQVVKKAPEDQIGPPSKYKQEYMYDACESRGYQVISKFNKQNKKTETYCKFNEDMACPIVEFATGDCSPGNNSITLNTKSEKKETKDCSEIGPVCGTNGHTYSNKCLSDRSGVEIDHEGKCKISDDRFRDTGDKGMVEQIKEKTRRDSSESKDKNQEGEYQPPEWLDGVMALFSTDLKQDTASIKKCSLDEKTYYMSESDKDYNAVYDEQGNIICNTDKNINQSCPNNLSQYKCEAVWNS